MMKLHKLNLIFVNCQKLVFIDGNRFFHSSSRRHQYATERELNTDEVDTNEELKHSILKAALPFVVDHSWSRLSLAKGAEAVGLSPVAHGLFPRGEAELVEYFNRHCNQQLLSHLTKCTPNTQRNVIDVNLVREALEVRLRMILPYTISWPKAMTLMAHPTNAIYSLRNLHQMIDDILYYSGDRSADFSWYPKRAGLAGIYVATELVLVQDKSTDCQDTWKFLDRRLTDYTDADNFYKKTESIIDGLPQFVMGSLTTVRNMLGVGSSIR